MSKDIFKTVDTIIRNERLYAQVNLMREDVMQRFGIGRHRLNDLLTTRTDMTITDVAREVGFTAPNLREQFKRCYGITPAEYRASLLPTSDEDC